MLILLLGYLYFRLAGEAYALVSIGLISFAAVAQFAPAILGGIFWKGGTRAGALCGLLAGFGIWLYTLLLPALARSGWLPIGLLEQGPFGIALLKPLQLFGLAGLDQISHAMIWSMIANVGAYVGVSLLRVAERRRAPAGERVRRCVPAHRRSRRRALLARHGVGPRPLQPARALPRHRARRTARSRDYASAHGPALARRGARRRRGARALRRSPARRRDRRRLGAHHGRLRRQGGDAHASTKCATILDEASQVVVYSHRLEQKSRELEAATAELREANERLKELDRLKDDFVSTVTHELRTPLTSIRAFTEILLDDPEVELGAAQEVPRHHHQGDRAADAAHQPGPRPRQDRIGQGRMGRDRTST